VRYILSIVFLSTFLFSFLYSQEVVINVYSDNVSVYSSDGCIVYGVQFDAYVSDDFAISTDLDCYMQASEPNSVRVLCFDLGGQCLTDLFDYTGGLEISEVIVAGPNGSSLEDVSIEYEIDEGDLNADGILDVIDIVYLVNLILDDNSGYNPLSDLTEDGIINVIDIVQMLNWILNVNEIPEEFIYPLAEGNEWIYNKYQIYSMVNTMTGQETTDTLITDITVSIVSDEFPLVLPSGNAIDVFKMDYEEIIDGYSSIQSYYVNNTEEGFMLFASDEYWEESALPILFQNSFNTILNDALSVSPFIFPHQNRDCMLYYNPPVNRIKYPIVLGNSWNVINEGWGIDLECDNPDEGQDHVVVNISRTISEVYSNGCFNIIQDNDYSQLADDLFINHTLDYCSDRGLNGVSFYGDLGTVIETDEMGNFLGEYESSIDITVDLIEYNLNDNEENNDSIYESQRHMVLVEGIVNYDALNPLGHTSDGYLEYNDIGSFPTLIIDYPLEFTGMDEFGNALGLFELSDFVTERFHIILKDTLSNNTISTDAVLLGSGINNIDLQWNSNGLNHSMNENEGDFNLIFSITDENNMPMNNVAIYLMSECNSDSSWGFCNDQILSNRATVSYDLLIPSTSLINISIQDLSGQIIEESTQYYSSGYYSFTFTKPDYLIDSGIQVYLLSIDVLEGNVNQQYQLSDPYPNPFN